MESLAGDAAEYMSRKKQSDDFNAQCKVLENKHKSELNDAKAGLLMYLQTQPVVRLPDASYLQIKEKKSTRVITRERIEEAVECMKQNTLAAFHEALNDACTVITHLPLIANDPGVVPQGTFVKPAPKAVQAMCKQWREAEDALKRVRKHKRDGKKRVADVLTKLEKQVEVSYTQATGLPATDASSTSITLRPPPPLVDDDEEASVLPAVPEDVPVVAGQHLEVETPQVAAPVRIRVKESKERRPTLKPKTYMEALAEKCPHTIEDKDMFKSIAVQVFTDMKQQTGDGGAKRRKLTIEPVKVR